MNMSVAPSHQDYSGLLHPTVWSPRVVEEFYDSTPLEKIANTDYEGEIRSFGDTVKIRKLPEIESHEYEKGQDLETDVPDQPMTTLHIDRGEYFNFLVEDVDRAQSDMDYMDKWTAHAGKKQIEKINAIVLGEAYVDAHADNQGDSAGHETGYYNLGKTGAPVSITTSNVIDVLGYCAAVLDEFDIPEDDRWMTVPPWFRQMVFSSNVRDALVQGGDQEMLRKGYIGELATFPLYSSNKVSKVDDGGTLCFNIMFGHRSALTFASQLVNSDVIKSEKKFGRFARGLHVFGYNVNKSEAMGVLYCTRG